MPTIEIPAKTPEEAIEIALKELDAERGEVEIDVVSHGKAGILGIGSEPAKVKVTLVEQPADVVKETQEVLNSLISAMGVDVIVNLKQAHNEDLGGPMFEIEGEDSGVLIGRRGETLRSLQFLVKFIVRKRLQFRAALSIDVEGYQARRYNSLNNLARRVAQRVLSTGSPITLEPMPANERRIVHVTLAEHSGVTTESIGIGEERQVVIQPS